MSETLVNTIDGDKLYAERAVKDASGNSISETYATKSEIPVVDQAYDATSTNAQSGVAVAEALSNVPSSSYSAGGGIDINNSSRIISAKADGTSITYNANGELEAHNTLTGGGGIDINAYNVISAKADGSSITYNSNGELEAHNTLIAGGGIDINAYNVISAKADGTTITYNANGELQATSSGGVTDVTVDGTSVVNGQGVAEITMPTFTQVQSDWSQSDNTKVDYIKNKPSLATVATSGDYDDLTNKPSIPAAQVNSDWNASSGVSAILNKPTLATVATTGAYSDLSGTPTINNVPTVGSTDDGKVLTASYSGGVGSYSWTTPGSGGGDIFPVEYGVTTYAQITDALTAGKVPVLKVVDTANATHIAFLSYYNSTYKFTHIVEAHHVAGEPSSFAAWEYYVTQSNNWQTRHVDTYDFQANWNDTNSTSLGYIRNKPTLATVATSGSYNDLSDKPTIPTMELFEAVYGTTTYAAITSAIAAKKIVYCRVSPSGATRMAFLAYIGSNNVEFQYYRSLSSRSATSQLDEVYVYTVNASGWTTTTRKAGVLIAAGTGLTSSYSGGTLTINGKDTDQTYNATSANPQSGVAVAGALAGKEDAEVVLYDASGSPNQTGPWTLSEARTNFEYLDIYIGTDSSGNEVKAQRFLASSSYMKVDISRYDEDPAYKVSMMTLTFNQLQMSIATSSVARYMIATNGTVSVSTASTQAPWLFKVVGIHRIASN